MSAAARAEPAARRRRAPSESPAHAADPRGVWIGGIVLLLLIFGIDGRNNAYQPQNEFKLDTWFKLGVFSINKGVLYLLLAAITTACR